MTETTQEQDEFAGLIKSVLSPSCSLEFKFERKNENGEVEQYPMRVKLLRREEEMFALAEAQQRARELKETPKEYGDIYREEQAVSLLQRALCKTKEHARPDGTKFYPPIFVDCKTLRQSFTSAEMAQCLNFYEIVKAHFSSIRLLDDQTIDEWAHQLAEPGGAFFLSRLDSDHWPGLIIALSQELAAAREELGRPLSISPDTTESDRPSSTPDTGDFSSLPSGQVSSPSGDVPVPTDRLLNKSEASSIAQRVEASAKGEDPEDGSGET